MPQCDNQKLLPHPAKARLDGAPHGVLAQMPHAAPTQPPHAPLAQPAYAELQVTTNFTFLTGASHPEEYAQRAAELGYRGLAITDVNSLAGAVRMHVGAKQAGIPLAIGCRVVFEPAPEAAPLSLLVYVTDRAGYGRLCRLLTLGKRRADKGTCRLALEDVLTHCDGWLGVLLSSERDDAEFRRVADELRAVFSPQRLSLAISCPYGPDDRGQLRQIAALGKDLGLPLAATNAVQYHIANRKLLHDVLACIREGCTLETAGYRLRPNAEQYLKPPAEMYRLFAEYPAALARSVSIIEQAAAFSLDELRYEYPHETCPPETTPMEHLTALTWAGAAKRFPGGVPEKVKGILRHELALIAELNYPAYFLTVHDLVKFARGRGILCQGRGAAANSAVCFCLGVTEVDPSRMQLLFERFVSKERDEPPDIDIDFEHERREEVIQYIYQKYGRQRAALTAEVITYRRRSAVREVGKALGLSLDCVDRLAKDHDWFEPHRINVERLRELGLNPEDPTMLRLRVLVGQILGFPRHLSQHVGGFVMTEGPLCESVPIENAAMPERTVIEWDKDDIEALGMMKVDVLGLGMLTCVRKSFELIEQHHGRRYEMHSVPAEDARVYDMICEADTVGVFQIESRAQMSMLPRLRPRCFYDLVIEVAIVRPGPIQGGMVHPYLRRRTGQEPVSYPSEAVREVLQRTLGVPLFQEQAMSLSIKAAGFTPGEADALRRAMAAWKRKGHLMQRFGERIINGMLANGYERDFAERCFKQIMGFGEYGFPESHAASFALIVYVSCWLKWHHPAVFAAALINSQPMGFYAPAQIIRDVKAHGVTVRPVDVNHSRWDCTLERDEESGELALRLGMRLVKGLGPEAAERISTVVTRVGRVDSVERLWRLSGAPVRALRALASADAFNSLGLDRQHARWQIQRLHDEELPLFEEAQLQRAGEGEVVELPSIGPAYQMLGDYQSTGLSLKAHPLAFLRPRLEDWGVVRTEALSDLARCPHGRPIAVAGMVLVRQRPSTSKGVTFFTIEDETGTANLIVRPPVFERFRRVARHAAIVLARGTVERDSTTGRVVHVMVSHLSDLTRPQSLLRPQQRNFH